MSASSRPHERLRLKAEKLIEELVKLYDLGHELNLLEQDAELRAQIDEVIKRFRACIQAAVQRHALDASAEREGSVEISEDQDAEFSDEVCSCS